MKESVALQRYLQRHIETDLPATSVAAGHWQRVLVVPAYAESAEFLHRISQHLPASERVLIILVLNRPESDNTTDANEALRKAVRALPLAANNAAPDSMVFTLNQHTDLLLYDMEQLRGPNPKDQGVGLARKAGCDIALQWMAQGTIQSNWICSSDADAILPADYFQRLDPLGDKFVAATFPFHHLPASDPSCTEATGLYELRLHHYVLGLSLAKSPYAHHTLGSALAVRADNYAQVRGMPKRSGGEDFYLLNKLAKVGAIAQLSGQCISLQSRLSHRVPFGTGPAVSRIASAQRPQEIPLFYHPYCFVALQAVLNSICSLYDLTEDALPKLLATEDLPPKLVQASCQALLAIGLPRGLGHCYKQSNSTIQFQRHFHQWFDGFRTLKFIHALRDGGLSDQNLNDLTGLAPALWPTESKDSTDMEALRRAIRQHLGWSTAS